MLYEPAEDSYLLEKFVKIYAKGLVLDMGTGSGIQAKAAAEISENVVAVDISDKALKYVSENINNPKITFLKSDLFSNVEGLFDTIIFNPPYLPDEEFEDKRLFGGKDGHEIVEKFLISAKSYLNEGGVILLLISSLTGEEKIKQILDENGYQYDECGREHIFFEDLIVYKICLKKND